MLNSNAQTSYGRAPTGLTTNNQYGALPTGVSSSQFSYGSAPTGQANNQYGVLPTGVNQPFVDGTVYQLARALYTVHTNHESLPSGAIADAIRTFGANPERNIILQAARYAAEALEKKRFILLNNSKSQTTMTVFEQMVSLRELRIEKLEKEHVKIYDSSPEGSTTESLLEEYDVLYSMKDQLKLEVFNRLSRGNRGNTTKVVKN